MRKRSAWLCAMMAAMAAMAVTAMMPPMPVLAQVPSRMNTGVRNYDRVQRGTIRLDDLTPAERLEVLRIAQGRRSQRRGVDLDCRLEQERRPMSDLERRSWRLKCRR